MKLIFLGPPGAGKGTIAEKAVKELKLTQISTGALFRTAIKEETELGKKVQAIIQAGDLVPDELTIALVQEKLADIPEQYILDGFPRTTGQADALKEFASIDGVINFTLDDSEVIKRLSGRRMCRSCGASFHIDFVPPAEAGKCDHCGGELYTRDDDAVSSIENRLKVYRSSTEPLINYYRERKLIIDIDASPAPQQVFLSLKNTLKDLQKKGI